MISGVIYFILKTPEIKVNDDMILLFKGGKDKQFCSNAPFLKSSYVNNYYNSYGNIIDGCEMRINSEIIFGFKQHDQTFRSHSGVIQVKITTMNLENGASFELYTAHNESKGLDISQWNFCRTFKNIPNNSNRVITTCDGEGIGYIKIKSIGEKSIFLDSVEAYRYS